MMKMKKLCNVISWYLRNAPWKLCKKNLYRLGNRLVKRMCGTQIFRVGDNDIELDMPSDDRYESIWLLRTYEYGTTLFLNIIIDEDDIVFDIGAGIGWHTINMARMLIGGKCHSFEPRDAQFKRMQRNCDLNGLGNVVVLNKIGIGKTNDMTVSIDDHVRYNNINTVDVIKIDTDGAEKDIIVGTELFKRFDAPIIVFEAITDARKQDVDDILSYLGKCGYTFLKIDRGWGEINTLLRSDRGISACIDINNGDMIICIKNRHLLKLAKSFDAFYTDKKKIHQKIPYYKW